MSEEAEKDMAADDWAATAAEQDPTESVAAGTGTGEAVSTGPVVSEPAAAASEPQKANIFQNIATSDGNPAAANNLDLILDIPVQLTVELGRTKIAIRNLLQLAQGSVVELDGLAGEPMDVMVNGCLIAQGEVVVVNDKFGIRLTDIISPAERLRRINR